MTSPHRMPLLERGDRVGDYVVREPLGVGGIGTVYLAKHAGTRAAAALKVHEHPGDGPAARGRLGHEALMLMRVSTPQVPRVLDLELGGDMPHLAMSLAGRESLAQRVRREGPLDIADAAGVVAGAATALQAVHDAGILHMDLTPANIVLDDSQVRIVDFGAALSIDGWSPLAGPGSYDGTVGYVAPERCLGAPPHCAMDVFSLAAVTYRALIGVRPYVDDRTYETTRRAHGKRLVSPYLLRPEMGPEMADVLVRSLSLDPSARPATPLEFATHIVETVPSSACLQAAAARAFARQRLGLRP